MNKNEIMKRIACWIIVLPLLVTAVLALPQAGLAGLRLIVVRTESEANDLRARVLTGEKFDELARVHSVDPSARGGGYLGAMAISQLRPEFQAALEGLRPGEVSRVATIGRQYALLQVVAEDDTRDAELKAWRDAGADPNSRSLEPLWIMATTGNRIDLVRVLLEAGANASMTFGDGSTVLMGAAQDGRTEMVRVLLAAGASVNAQAVDGSSALLAAAYGGHLETVRLLLQAGSAVDARLMDGSTVLMKTAQAGHTEVVRALAGAGAAVNARAANGLTALIDASFAGHTEVVRVLLASRADPNLALTNRSTALMAASQKGHSEIVRLLLGAGAVVDARSDTGTTALLEAAYDGRAETVLLLLAAGADAKVSMTTGLTALMGAALGGHTEVARSLLDAGADPNAKDGRGWTALTNARASTSIATVELLLARMPSLSAKERSLALGGTYVNEYYSSNENRLLALAAAEFQKVLEVEPRNVEAIEWLGAIAVLQWSEVPTIDQFRKANSLLMTSVDLDPKDRDRHYWIAATNSVFVSRGSASPADAASIVEQGIEHGRKAVELDPQFAAALDHLSILYSWKSERAASQEERDSLARLADASRQDAARIRVRLGDRPSRPGDQFTRPALPPAPAF